MRESILRDKSYAFAIRIVELNRFLCKSHNEYILSKQMLRSGTAVGALMSLLKDTNYIDQQKFESMSQDCSELIRMLVATVKTTSRPYQQ